MRPTLGLIAIVLTALLLAACGSEGVSSTTEASADADGAQLFAENCAGCHTIDAAGTQGSGNRAQRVQGPNLDQRTETYDDVLFAIRNGGYSGAIMPQNIVIGEQADAVAQFVADNSGTDVDDPPLPGGEEADPSTGETGDAASSSAG